MHLNSPTHKTAPVRQAGRLYIVATPIGNRDDITIRALRILAEVDQIAAEDTRLTRRLLTHHQIKGHLISYHEHNEIERTPQLIQKLMQGGSIALVSNAGTPAVSDPGYRLVKEAAACGTQIIPIPGPSAAIAALSAAGLPTDAFVFVGFVSKKQTKRLKHLHSLKKEPRTIVFYESPKRITALIKELLTVFGDRYGVLCREMTKVHEEFIRDLLSAIWILLNERPAVKGECTLLVAGCNEKTEVSVETVREDIKILAGKTGQSLSEIVRAVSKKYGLPKNTVYRQALHVITPTPGSNTEPFRANGEGREGD